MIVVDSSVWIDRFRDRDTPAVHRLARAFAEQEPVCITDVVFAELLSGARGETEVTRIERLFTDLLLLRLEDLDDYRLAASCRRAAAAAGTRVRWLTDCLIAAVCIREDVPLLHADRDFDTLAACTPLCVVAT